MEFNIEKNYKNKENKNGEIHFIRRKCSFRTYSYGSIINCKIYQHLSNEIGCPPTKKCHTKEEFIFIILYLYSPSTLAGGKITDT